MNIESRMRELSSGNMKRSAAAEESLKLRVLYPYGNDICQILAYDIPGGTPDNYQHIDALIPYCFGKEWVKKILNTTWIIDTSFNAFQIKIELKDDFPVDSKIVIMPVRRQEIVHSGLDEESISWLSAQR